MASSILAELLGWHGKNPEKLPLFDGDLTKYQKDVLDDNLAIAPKAANLADLVNTSNTQQLLKAMESMLPGYMKTLTQGLGNAFSLMQGEVSDSTKRAVADYSATRGIGRGTSGSEFDRNAEVNLFGATVEQSQARGLDQFLNIAQRAPRAPQFDFTSMFQTPAMRAQFEMNKYQMNLPVMQFNNWVKSLPTNLERAGGMFLDWAATTGLSIAGAYTGMGMNQMGGEDMPSRQPAGGSGGGGGSSFIPSSGGSDMPYYPTESGGPGGYPESGGQGTGEGGAIDWWKPSMSF